jgi:hypothetical protein
MTIPVWVALGGMGLTSGLTVLAFQWRFATRLARMELKVDTVWDFLIKRARVEVVNVGWGQMQSPLVLNSATLTAIMPFVLEVVAFYGEVLRREPAIREADLFIAIERQFGDRIVEQVCIPHGVNLGACLIAVIEACRVEHERRKTPREDAHAGPSAS